MPSKILGTTIGMSRRWTRRRPAAVWLAGRRPSPAPALAHLEAEVAVRRRRAYLQDPGHQLGPLLQSPAQGVGPQSFGERFEC